MKVEANVAEAGPVYVLRTCQDNLLNLESKVTSGEVCGW